MAARISRFVAYRVGASMRFTWRLAVSTDVIGFDLYAGQRRLNARTILVHASLEYLYGVTGRIMVATPFMCCFAMDGK